MLINDHHLFTANGFHNIHTKILAWCFCGADAAIVCKLGPNTSPGADLKMVCHTALLTLMPSACKQSMHFSGTIAT